MWKTLGWIVVVILIVIAGLRVLGEAATNGAKMPSMQARTGQRVLLAVNLCIAKLHTQSEEHVGTVMPQLIKVPDEHTYELKGVFFNDDAEALPWECDVFFDDWPDTEPWIDVRE